MVLLLCVCLLWPGPIPGQAWVADKFYKTREGLPYGINQILKTLFEPGEEMLDAHRQWNTLYLLSENREGKRRVFIFRDEGRGYALDVVSPPLSAINGVKPTIGSSGELYLMYDSNYCFHRAGGKWLLNYVQFVDEYEIHTHYMRLEHIKGMPWDEQPPAIGRYTGERDLSKITADDLPLRFADAWALFDRTGYAVVNSPDPKDRLHLRRGPSQQADSLGEFYNGTILQVLEKRGDWRRVAIGSLEGWMMGRCLVEGEAMDGVKTAFPILDLREGLENAPRFRQPTESAAVITDADWEGDWQRRIIGVIGEEWFILMSREGQLYYQKQAWFWEGNG